MNGQSVTWSESDPAITEAAGLGFSRIQSDKTSTRIGLNDEHNWPSSGGTAVGYHRYGSARPFYGTQSRVSSDGTDARLMLTSDTSQLFAMTSAGTVLVGGHRVISAFTAPSTLPQRHQWVEEFGFIPATGSSTSTVVYSSAFSGVPYVFLQSINGAFVSFDLITSRTTDFRVMGYQYSDGSVGPTGGFAAYWRSIGSRAL